MDLAAVGGTDAVPMRVTSPVSDKQEVCLNTLLLLRPPPPAALPYRFDTSVGSASPPDTSTTRERTEVKRQKRIQSRDRIVPTAGNVWCPPPVTCDTS